MQRHNSARRFLVIAEIENPLFVFVSTDWVGPWKGRIALPLLLATILNQFADVDRRVTTHHDVVATRTERVSRRECDESFAGIAEDLEPADHAPANQVTVVESVLINDVTLEPVEIVFGEQLSGKETRPAETFKPAANRTAGYCGYSSSRRSECHKILLPDNSAKK